MDLQFTQIIFLLTILPMKIVYANDECIGNVCIPNTYDKTVLPLQNEINDVKVDFKGIRILKVDDEEFTIRGHS